MALQKRLGTTEVFAISVGAMISSGVFILPGLAYAMSGPSMILAYLLAGLFAVPALMSKIELATAMPKAGGVYFYIDRSMGAAMGTVGGLAGWFSLCFKSAFALVGIGAFAPLLFPGLGEMEVRLIAAGFCVLFTVVNLLGVSHAGRSQVYMVAGLLVILGVYVAAGIGQPRAANYMPFLSDGVGGLFATVGLVFVAFGGLTKAASVAEEVKDPGRTLPLGMFLAFGVVLVLYVLTTFVTVGVVQGAELAKTLTPMNLGADVTFGTTGVVIITIGAILAFVSTANAGILAASRIPLAMSRDGLLPETFEEVDPRRGTPVAGVLVTGGFMVAVILLLDLESLVKTASTLKLLLFILVNVAVILMRESGVQSYRPAYKGSLYPWLQIGGIVVYLALITMMGTLPVLLSLAFVVLSVLWYALYGRANEQARDSAVIYIVKRIAGRAFSGKTLGTELREILQERDGIHEDRFDRLVAACPILEIDGKPTLEEFLSQAAEELAPAVGLTADGLARRLIEAERASSTAIDAHLAIPHVRVDGNPRLALPHAHLEGVGGFHLLVARCKAGVEFSAMATDVQAMFVMVGGADQRQFHLRALAAIAQTAQQPDFRDRWRQAAAVEDLRDLLLLSTRERVVEPD